MNVFIEGKKVILADEKLIQQVESRREETNSHFKELSDLLKKYDYPVTEANLRGAFREGFPFFLNEAEKEIKKAFKGTPVSPRSIERLVKEKQEDIPHTFERELVELRRVLRLDGFSPLDDEIEYKGGKLYITESFLDRAKKTFSREATPEEIVLKDDIKTIIEKLRSVHEKGYRIIPEQYPSPQMPGVFFMTGSLVSDLMNGNGTDEEIYLSMEQNKQRYFKDSL